MKVKKKPESTIVKMILTQWVKYVSSPELWCKIEICLFCLKL